MNEVPEKMYGIVAEFPSPEIAAKAALKLREKGFTDLDAYGPFPSSELAEAIGFREKKIARCVLIGGIIGGLSGYALQYYASVIDYPHNIGGRPFHSWPSFIPITFEMTVLCASITGIVSLLILNGLPRLSHPVFSAKHFDRATTDRFFLSVRADHSNFSEEKVREIFGEFSPLSISILPKENSR